jgi:hypothetical protein
VRGLEPFFVLKSGKTDALKLFELWGMFRPGVRDDEAVQELPGVPHRGTVTFYRSDGRVSTNRMTCRSDQPACIPAVGAGLPSVVFHNGKTARKWNSSDQNWHFLNKNGHERAGSGAQMTS